MNIIDNILEQLVYFHNSIYLLSITFFMMIILLIVLVKDVITINMLVIALLAGHAILFYGDYRGVLFYSFYKALNEFGYLSILLNVISCVTILAGTVFLKEPKKVVICASLTGIINTLRFLVIIR